MTITHALSAHELLQRWDDQQTAFIKHRDQRFNIMVDTIARLAPARPRILDLACGPGSLSLALLRGIPECQVIAVDKDPVLLKIAEDVLAANTRAQVLDVDLNDVDWQHSGLEGPFDAIVSSTALHWLEPETLSRLYFQLAQRLRPGGIFMNADHLYFDGNAQSTLHQLAKADDQTNQDTAFSQGVDNWEQWWERAESRPDYAAAVEERRRRWANDTPPTKVTLGYHLETLRSAGFKETGTIWQYLDDYVICAIR